ncbi:MAG: glycosyltransferase family 9 protein [Ignavibacteriales bacterium]|nr:glycosyltransferase family 9 protein [Ignavibacteriales bacterium]
MEYNLRLMHAIGEHSVVNTANVEYNFRIPEAVVVDLPFPLDVQGLQSPVIVIHPGSGGSAVDLPVEKFAALTGLLAGHGKYTLIVTGNTAELELCKTVCGTTNAINLAGKLNLLQLMVIIQKSNIFVSNSTGPLHIAAAMGKYAIGFFPKIKTCSPERWAPYTEKRAVFVPELGCSNCTREQCARLECMNSIDIQKVVEKIEKFSLSVDSGADNV